jgi:hypothetical protein
MISGYVQRDLIATVNKYGSAVGLSAHENNNFMAIFWLMVTATLLAEFSALLALRGFQDLPQTSGRSIQVAGNEGQQNSRNEEDKNRPPPQALGVPPAMDIELENIVRHGTETLAAGSSDTSIQEDRPVAPIELV